MSSNKGVDDTPDLQSGRPESTEPRGNNPAMGRKRARSNDSTPSDPAVQRVREGVGDIKSRTVASRSQNRDVPSSQIGSIVDDSLSAATGGVHLNRQQLTDDTNNHESFQQISYSSNQHFPNSQLVVASSTSQIDHLRSLPQQYGLAYSFPAAGAPVAPNIHAGRQGTIETAFDGLSSEQLVAVLLQGQQRRDLPTSNFIGVDGRHSQHGIFMNSLFGSAQNQSNPQQVASDESALRSRLAEIQHHYRLQQTWNGGNRGGLMIDSLSAGAPHQRDSAGPQQQALLDSLFISNAPQMSSFIAAMQSPMNLPSIHQQQNSTEGLRALFGLASQYQHSTIGMDRMDNTRTVSGQAANDSMPVDHGLSQALLNFLQQSENTVSTQPRLSETDALAAEIRRLQQPAGGGQSESMMQRLMNLINPTPVARQDHQISLGGGFSSLLTQDESTTNIMQANTARFATSEVSASLPSEGSAELPLPEMPTLAADGFPVDLPAMLFTSADTQRLSPHQIFLRQQIEAFRASESDIGTHKRGRNKPIILNQVGIRCRHCAHIPVEKRQKGSTYFPASCSGIYQASQNMNTMHLQCGLCSEMPEEVRHRFSFLLAVKGVSLGAGRPYWEKAAKDIGLVDTPDGIRFFRDDLSPGAGDISGGKQI